jgi:hypothetical protein
METLEKLSRDLFRPAFDRYGAAYAELLRQWPAIVGEERARVSRPEKLSRRSGPAETERPGRLTIAVAPGHALLLEHDKPRILERINTVFGFGLVDALKVVTSDRGWENSIPTLDAPQNDPTLSLALKVKLKTISDDRLREALARLGAGVLSQASRKATAR